MIPMLVTVASSPTTVAPPTRTLALALLALAPLITVARPARGRLRELRTPPAADLGPVPTVRRSWVIVGALALGALAWAAAGAAAGVVVGGAVGAASGLAVRWTASRAGAGGAHARIDRELAGSWELLAVCLEAGLPVSVAVSAATEPLPGPIGTHLRRIAGLLALGADPAAAWASTQDVPALAAFARAAARSAGTGTALAQVARAEGARLRGELLDSAQARAQRAAVLITAPLGLCFLPAFLVLGIAPVVIGLAGEALSHW